MTFTGPGRVACALAGLEGEPDNAFPVSPNEELHVW